MTRAGRRHGWLDHAFRLPVKFGECYGVMVSQHSTRSKATVALSGVAPVSVKRSAYPENCPSLDCRLTTKNKLSKPLRKKLARSSYSFMSIQAPFVSR